ncbi:probable E3 ubiquitin-protein ligase makorin-1 [Euwallacea similis]|uniref:probable E3 ubiquitin-protein ligase makorin-1 n=1 Tax=Euwallacea similis TaxID=1736056 RepID=UPI00344DBFCB
MNIANGYRDNLLQRQGRTICQFYLRGTCRFGIRCRNVHSDLTESPRQPNAAKPNQIHNQNHNLPSRTFSAASTNTNQSTASGISPSASTSTEARSIAATLACGICFDTIMEKTDFREQTFGILPNCNHCFCFACIRKWRQSKEFDFEVSKACPECRQPSDYVYPSRIWFEIQEEKQTFIRKEKTRMQKINCRYFSKGSGYCPFGNTCLYLHALPNGTKMDVGPPKPRRRRISNVDTEMLHQILYWLNDDELDIDDNDEELDDADFDLDLDDPTIAMQYYDHDDFRRFMAMNSLMNPDSTDSESDLDFSFLI